MTRAKPDTTELRVAISGLRRSVHETQEKFAARVGVTARAIANYEAGRRPTPAVLMELASIGSRQGQPDLVEIFSTHLPDRVRRAFEKGTRSLDSGGTGGDVRRELDELLKAACHRLLATEAEVLAMDPEPRDWFMSKPGHRDCFTVARALLRMLDERENS